MNLSKQQLYIMCLIARAIHVMEDVRATNEELNNASATVDDGDEDETNNSEGFDV